jgi:hypothetical protein
VNNAHFNFLYLNDNQNNIIKISGVIFIKSVILCSQKI